VHPAGVIDGGRGPLRGPEEGARPLERGSHRPPEVNSTVELAKATGLTERMSMAEDENAKRRRRPVEHAPQVVPIATVSTAATSSAPRLHLLLPVPRRQRRPMSLLPDVIEKDDLPSLLEYELSDQQWK